MLTTLSDSQIARFSMVPGDSVAESMLRELRHLSGRRWLIRVTHHTERVGFFRGTRHFISYRLYEDANGGEWHITNLITAGDGFEEPRTDTRELVLNYMQGQIDALRYSKNKLPAWVDEFLDRRTAVEHELRLPTEIAKKNAQHNRNDPLPDPLTPDQMLALANKLSVPAEFNRSR